VKVDGATAVGLVRFGSGFLHLRLGRGVHRVEAAGPVPPGDTFTLQFADPPAPRGSRSARLGRERPARRRSRRARRSR
jgi:hypothetical protein